MLPKDLERRFTYHPPSGSAKAMHGSARMHVKDFAELIDSEVHADSREMSLFWTHLEQASFWLHAHIARNEPHEGS